ncbi:type II toxin-antitoxin system VapC family toxin [Brucella anthropi]|uniref:Ribonuclease VapC n=1 Tax=Brucella anthropi (strain ATCC 49188 / DSM 6882 / CCUG 24695 / JCM 21032 / LMG 3331 / NBRC 15819 / NCTC 12168 / Alc 37) TaxID=439375 RepID=A6X8D1_BRUA4|nr:type II toxin-antitoxin system VapC family toxin [Brucella anthropi]ABS17485.1 PilT protein domain protein [Brucella anthropi ATCC 49188]AIK41076.1 PIN domain protein [Brucella anthropi]KAB2726277.1 type II toxin-antitoxin system VapC family toxin [Brucella anthropi]KAB2744613.1 type II toxin-antitoxin system VapC family toxin [Brucella anthropi]KAB2774642.1 type II toxin-antitoxin system VapC family toxin [Brucella anthropi]
MIAIDTSVILAIALREPEADPFERLVRRDAILIGWPTLLELRMVLTGKGFANAAAIVDQLIGLPNVTTIAFDEAQYRAAERAFDRFGKGRHAAGLNMGDCFSYAVASIARAPLLFKGHDFGKTDLKLHPESSTA